MKRIFKIVLLTAAIGTALAAPAHAANKLPSGGTAYKNNYYKIYTGKYTWTEANKLCKSMGGHLVTITSAKEQAFIDSLNKNTTRLWIGAYRNSNNIWKWVTGEKWTYTNWAAGEPNNSSNVVSNENRASVWPKKWNDLADGNIYEQRGFICEWEGVIPNKPTVTSIKKKTGTIKGKTSKNATVYITIGNTTYKGKANANGVFKIKTRKISSQTKIKIYAKSASNGKSKTLKLTVI